MAQFRTTKSLSFTAGTALLAALLLAPVHYAQAQDLFLAAESAATADAASAEGKRFGEEVGQAFGREHGGTIQDCAKNAKRRDLSDLHVFLRVDGTGVVDKTWVSPVTPLSTCVQDKMAGWKVAVPPRVGFWVMVDVNLKGK